MPRALIVLLAILVLIVVGLFALANMNTEVPLRPIEQPVTPNAAQPG